jgi:hypothetical protein
MSLFLLTLVNVDSLEIGVNGFSFGVTGVVSTSVSFELLFTILNIVLSFLMISSFEINTS